MAPISIWFVTGSQHLYGPETLRQVAANSQQIVDALRSATQAELALQPVQTDPESIRELCARANADPNCAGLILWMHTFSPAKMWIGALSGLRKPICHLHTQFHQEIPWQSIDMDFMNLNQAAHGDREAAHLHGRLHLRRRILVGHWSAQALQNQLTEWCRTVTAWHRLQGAKVARFGDNMRSVAVTEGDKVAAEIQFGVAVDGYGVGDLVDSIQSISPGEVSALIDEVQEAYQVSPPLQKGGERHNSLVEAARQEAGIAKFLSRGYIGFTTTFEDLHGLNQLPGLACQRLMSKGFGFGAEGDWKTAALLAFAKIAEDQKEPGTSFMEDYTYHLSPGNEAVLGAHMLEICPSIASAKPKLEIHPLGIGGKSDPVRLVFDARPGPATNASLVDLGHRFRLVVNTVETIEVPSMPKLPVARALWKVHPTFAVGVEAWLRAGGAHHTVYSQSVSVQQYRDFAELAGIEIVVIDQQTDIQRFASEIRWNEACYR
jgi:L-arabinose isomerase